MSNLSHRSRVTRLGCTFGAYSDNTSKCFILMCKSHVRRVNFLPRGRRRMCALDAGEIYSFMLNNLLFEEGYLACWKASEKKKRL